MSAIDSNVPVLVGVGQFLQKPANIADALEPVAMMAEALQRAAADSGAASLLSKLGSIRVVKGAWPYRDPGRLIANQLNLSPRHTAISSEGGQTPQSLVNQACLDIQAGRVDAIALVGGEGIWSRRRARRNKAVIPYTSDADAAPAPVLGKVLSMSSPLEEERGFEAPINIYPTFESAIRHARGETIEAHRTRISELWAGFNKVAVANPYAWVRTPMTAEQIRTPSDSNRMVGFPYTKAMNSNWDLDQAAAVILCSAGTAESLGISRDRWVFPWAGTDAHDTMLISNRDNFHSSAAIRTAAKACFELANASVADVAHVDLYSCFPSAVQISADAIGLDQSRQLTVTGGLPFAGGPLNNYVMHGIATMAEVLRSHPADLGLVTANGGFVTKHAIGLYSTEPPSTPFRHRDVQDEVDCFPTRDVLANYSGPVTIEAYTVMYGHEGAERALVAALTPTGERVLTSSNDAALMAAMTTVEHIGRAAEVDPSATVHI